MIEVRDLVAGYTRDVDILQGVTLSVGRAEIVTLLGPNGCGKSTLLKCIAGYLPPRRGTVAIEGAEVGRLPVHRKTLECALGFVPQTDNVFPALSVRENLQIGGHAMERSQYAERLAEILALYPVLARKLRAPASALSGGERQVLALARALMPRPRTLLLDEPSAGLSPKVLHEVFDAILRLRSREVVAILMVEQNAVQALGISDRAYVLSLGKVALSGRADELLRDDAMREIYLGARPQQAARAGEAP